MSSKACSMVQNEYEYIEYLVQGGLRENSAYSYGRYLEAVSSHLDIVVSANTISSGDEIRSIIERLNETEMAQRYVNNCGTALRAYLRFLNENTRFYVSPDEIEDPSRYVEGAKKLVTVNSYERNFAARQKCIEIHGIRCSICNMSFDEVYGQLGIGFIHVHHIKPLNEVNNTYEVNPETDLIPVCPNCHAMLHRPRAGILVDRLKEIFNEQKASNKAN
jgi:5-methylcytosine-specific restriction enzyme A